jgi:RimJ/RimL family protein N-acetyltransferase
MELMNTANYLKYIGDKNIRTIKDCENNLKNGALKSYKEHGFGFYKILLKEENNKCIGSCGLIKRDNLEHVEIGFTFFPNYEGKGFGYESSIAILKIAKEQFNIKKITAITLEINKNSIKLLEKLGLSYEKRVKPFEDDKELLLYQMDL